MGEHGPYYDLAEQHAEIDRLRSLLATAEGEADRLRSAYDDVRALNIKLTTHCTAELAAKEARIAQLEAWRAACQEVRCYRVVEAETEALRKQLQDERNDHDHTIARLTERLEASHGALKDALKLGDDTIEALRKQLAEFGAGEDTTTMTRKSFAEVLQALADVKKELAEAKAAMARTEVEAQVCMAGIQAALEAGHARSAELKKALEFARELVEPEGGAAQQHIDGILDAKAAELRHIEETDRVLAANANLRPERDKWIEFGADDCAELALALGAAETRIAELEVQCLQWMKVCTREGEEHFLKRMWRFEREKTALLARAEVNGCRLGGSEHMTKLERAIKIANKILDKSWMGPDSDERVLARQFLRALEREAEKLRELDSRDSEYQDD